MKNEKSKLNIQKNSTKFIKHNILLRSIYIFHSY